MKLLPSAATAALIALLGTACATDPGARDAERLSLYRDNAGEPVPSFRYFGRLSGWTPLGADAIAVWTRPGTAYLLEFRGSCPDIEYASAIQVTHQFSTVYARFDRVVPLGHTQPTIPCYIGTIRPLDVGAIRDAERTRRENVDTAERD